MILDTKVSYFNSTRDTSVAHEVLIGTILQRFKAGTYKDLIEEVRKGNSEAKKGLPTIAMHGRFESQRKKNHFIEASGLIILDIDDVVDDIEEIKQDIIESDDHVLAAMTSPSGTGIKVLYYVMPELVNAENYRLIGKQIIDEFEAYGDVDYLSITDCLIATYDPNIQINEECTPAFLYLEDTIITKKELPPKDENRELWEDAEEFFETVLVEDIASKTNNNYHFIQVSILDLAKFGFVHPKEDLSFVIDYSETYFKRSKDNKQRFLEVTELAKTYPQTEWPYRLGGSSDYEEEDEMDYSMYIDDSVVSKPKSNNDDSEESEEEEDFDGMVDYTDFKERMIQVIKEGDRVGFEISLENFANIFRIKGTGIWTITGIPTHGKTEMVDVVTLDLARLYGHETYVVGFEQTPEEHDIKLIRKMVGTNITCPSWFVEENMSKFDEAYNFVTSHIKHIDVKRVGGNVNKVLEILAQQIKKSRDNGGNPKYVVIDPFNMLSIKGKFNGHEKVEEILRRLTHFSHQMGVLVILVAHPFKMKKDEKTGQYEVPDFYSVKGSSAFYEMSYHGAVVYRNPDNSVLVKILKVKQNNLGEKDAEAYFNYHKPSGRYIPIDEEGNELKGDHRSSEWLDKVFKQD